MALQNIYQSILVLVLALRLACASISLPRYNITPQDELQQYDWKPRIFILSDILNEPDDSMSLVRYLLYSNEFDTGGAWIRYHYPDVFFIVSIHAFNEYELATWEGINQADCACVSNETVLNPWLDENIRLGPLGAVYPQITHGMEGDSPAFMWLIQNGLIYRDRIDWGTWGGRYNLPQAPSDVGSPFTANHYVNSLESAVGADNSTWKSVQASIWRWRTAYQDDFAARMQWTLTPSFAEVGHPPVLNVNGHEGPDPIYVPISAYQNYTFNASLTVDTDHPDDNGQLSFLWLVYPEPTTFFPEYLDVNFQPISSETDNANALNDAGFSTIISAQTIQITAPMELENSYTGRPTDFHLLLPVTNSAGLYPIRRYLRIICQYTNTT
ncbi:hypothetical protein E8E14_002296 [Neopestalotiopsis sp. 37M]|nr:hypothetical protein E8E14_002296 [Neopestalotiopsis sp. 37M]